MNYTVKITQSNTSLAPIFYYSFHHCDKYLREFKGEFILVQFQRLQSMAGGSTAVGLRQS
jgi:hypothetical protein